MSFNTDHRDQRLFTEDDFDSMSWHDNQIHAIAFGPGDHELSFDIDYILQWEQPLPEEGYYRFWVSPATLVFEDVYDLQVEQPDPYYGGLTLIRILREEMAEERAWPTEKKVWKWTLVCLERAEWVFTATGYRQCIRKPPLLLDKQQFDYEEREGYSFECPKRG